MQIFHRKGGRMALRGILALSIDPSVGPLIEEAFPYGFASSPQMFSMVLEMSRYISSVIRSPRGSEDFKYLYLDEFGLVGMLLTFRESMEKWFSIIALFNSEASPAIWKKKGKILKILKKGAERMRRGAPRDKVLEELYDQLVKIKI